MTGSRALLSNVFLVSACAAALRAWYDVTVVLPLALLHLHLPSVNKGMCAQVVKRMMCAFEGRCKVLYGPSALDRAREARKQPAGAPAAARDKLRAV